MRPRSKADRLVLLDRLVEAGLTLKARAFDFESPRGAEHLYGNVISCRPMSPPRSKTKTLLSALTLLLAVYGVLAYFLLPLAWTHHEHQKGLAVLPMATRTAQGIPGDPINVGLIGSKEDVLCAMHAAVWFPADSITLKSSIEIVGSVVLNRPYRDAPVSPLFYQDRREDLAFEKPDGNSADKRQHVRFWQVLKQGDEGRPVWLGSVTFDRGVGLSDYTGQVTHHIAPDIDTERRRLSGDLATAKVVAATYEVSGIGPTLNGRNGEGDRYYTDGEIRISRLVAGCNATPQTAVALANPPLVDLKNRAWRSIAEMINKP
jgi:hypothetical protein